MIIGFFTEGYLPQLNGVAISVEASVKALEKRGHKVYVFAPQIPGYKDKRDNVYRLPSVNVNKRADFRFATYFSRKSLMLASKIEFDIIHGHSGGPVTMLGWQVARLKGIPYVLTYHTMWSQYTHYVLKGKIVDPGMIKTASRIMGNWSDNIIAPTRKIKSELLKYGIDIPITVIPSGVDTEAFAKAKKGYLRKKLKIAQNEKILLYVGRLGKEKSVEDLVKMFHQLSKNNPGTSLVFVGDGDERQNLAKLAENLGISAKVYFTGNIDPVEIPGVYADADVFVFASRTETQGMVILEAMAAGVPVVAIEDTAFKELIHSQKNGILVRNISGFSLSVEKLLRDKIYAGNLSREGLKTASLYSVDIMAKKLEDYYNALLERKKKKRISVGGMLKNKLFAFLRA